jgi:dienelactone hydrolase
MDSAAHAPPKRSSVLFICGAITILLMGRAVVVHRQIEPIAISEQTCPVERIDVVAADRHVAAMIVRKPPGHGPFPAVIFLSGSTGERKVQRVMAQTPHSVLNSRYLAEGFVTVEAVHRSRGLDPQSEAALLDCRAIVDRVKQIPEVDPASVVALGHTGGGSLALELAGETKLCAVVVGEPYTILFTGMVDKHNRSRSFRDKLMHDPQQYYTPAVQQITRDRIARINCPLLIVHGDMHPIYKINRDLLLPELQRAGKQVSMRVYPGQPPGFLVAIEGDGSATLQCFHDCLDFFKQHLPTAPQPLHPELIQTAELQSRW